MRRLRFFLPILLLSVSSGCATAQPRTATDPTGRDLTAPLTKAMQDALTPEIVLQLLKDGNERFLAGRPVERNFLDQVRQTSGGQYPMATILGCIDSRVPHEIIFDKGVGDVFSARVAGNFVNTDILGSMEFATAVAGSKVIVVLGHTECGAIKGACDHVELGNLTSTLANIAPAVYAVDNVEGVRRSSNKAFVEAVSRANVSMNVNNIVNRSPVMRELVAEGKLMVIGAMHDVTTGRVTFMENAMVTRETLSTRR